MAATNRILTSRRLVLASTVFGLFVLFDIALFGWLIFDALSQREIEEVLLETRQQAEPIAEGLVAHAEAQGSEDLFVVVSVAEESRTYIESVLSRRELVRSIEIRNRDGMVVYQEQNRDDLPLDDKAPRFDDAGRPEQPLLETTVPIGDLGTLVVGLSREEVQRRIGTLRRDLVRHASLVGGFTVVLLVVGGVAFLQLFRRARRIEAQAMEKERLAYVGTLASGLAHEIRSPLNSLSLNMQMLEEETRDQGSSSQHRLLQITRSELRRLEGLATDFLAYAKPQPIERRAVPLVELLRRVREVLAAEIRERGVEVDVEDLTRGHEVSVDPAQFGQLLLNLCQNALAALDSVRRERLLRLVARFDDGDPVLEVIDNGEGIPDRVRMKMFDLFYSNRKGGTGLGLAIVQRIAEAHDAKVEVDTVPGSGTTVRVRFPRRQRSES